MTMGVGGCWPVDLIVIGTTQWVCEMGEMRLDGREVRKDLREKGRVAQLHTNLSTMTTVVDSACGWNILHISITTGWEICSLVGG